jgi:hypothetical protein
MSDAADSADRAGKADREVLPSSSSMHAESPRRQTKTSRAHRTPSASDLAPEHRAAIGAAARAIAERLHETAQREARVTIWRLVRWCGEERALAWLAEAERIEVGGGLTVASGERRRSLGGIFFHLAKGATTARERALIWPPSVGRGDDAAKVTMTAVTVQQPQRTPRVVLDQGERAALVATLGLGGVGDGADGADGDRVRRASSVKVTLVGRPEAVTERERFVTFALRPPERAPALPRGVPLPPPPLAGIYLVYVGAKQWRRVNAALHDPEDALIVEGFGLPSADLPATVEVYATNVTTKKAQAARRGARAEQTDEA